MRDAPKSSRPAFLDPPVAGHKSAQGMLTAVKHGDAEIGAFVLRMPASEEGTLGARAPRRPRRVPSE